MKKIIALLALMGACAAFAAETVNNYYTSGSVSSSTPTIIDVSLAPFPMTLTVIPGSGDTTLVEASTTPGAGTGISSAVWVAVSGLTAVTSNTRTTVASRVQAFRITRSIGSSTDVLEVNGGY
jgi:hypothetical protein